MLQVFPLLGWLAAITSGVMLALLWGSGDLRRPHAVVLLVWFLAAFYGQFLSASPLAGAIGLSLQTLLAIVLMTRSKLRP